jgi:DNA-binding CsgD family transcriptional regulator
LVEIPWCTVVDHGTTDSEEVSMSPNDPLHRPRRPGFGWAALTAGELRVVRLVVEGGTNREVAKELLVSPHTVDSHLRHAYRKLEVSSRVALTRVAIENERSRPD